MCFFFLQKTSDVLFFLRLSVIFHVIGQFIPFALLLPVHLFPALLLQLPGLGHLFDLFPSTKKYTGNNHFYKLENVNSA